MSKSTLRGASLCMRASLLERLTGRKIIALHLSLEGAHAFCLSIFGGVEHLGSDVRNEPGSGR